MDGIEVICFRGPREYLYGEETGLLEAIDGRPPFPRIAPPYRHGVEEMSEDTSLNPARVVLADPRDETVAPPTLVNNVETLANVPGISPMVPTGSASTAPSRPGRSYAP